MEVWQKNEEERLTKIEIEQDSKQSMSLLMKDSSSPTSNDDSVVTETSESDETDTTTKCVEEPVGLNLYLNSS